MGLPDTFNIVLDLWRAEREGAAGLARRQEARFKATLADARSSSRYYRRSYRNLPADGLVLSDLPVVTKSELMSAFDDWVTDADITRCAIVDFISDPARIATPFCGKYFVCTSTGTTGYPGIFVYDPGAIEIYRSINFARIAQTWLGPVDFWRMAVRGFRWASVLGTGGHYVGAGWVELERKRDVMRASAFRVFSVQQPLDQLVAALNGFEPAMLTAYPSALELLAEELTAGRLKIKPVILECGGETLAEDMRAHISLAFGCPLRSTYSASECLPIAYSCDHNWLHINSDWVILEPVDEDFRPTRPGIPSHTVLLTNLANRVQPLIRYDLGDSIVQRGSPCPCGSHLPAIRVIGRQDDIMKLRATNGKIIKILPLAIGTVVEEIPDVLRSQIVQEGPTSLRLRLTLSEPADVEKTWREATTKLQDYLVEQGVGNIAIARAPEPPQQADKFGKFRQVIATPLPEGRGTRTEHS